jgi:nitrite reductase/ring-hydroxylating ferredoxin subunit
VLGVFGLGAVGISGYLGGHLAYVRGVGVNTTAFQSGPDSWQRIADLGDLSTGSPTQIDLDGLALVAVRRGDSVAVLEDRCTHRGGPLSEGEVAGTCIRCPWHDSLFSLDDGSVERGPASIPQPSYRVRVVDGSVEIERDEPGGLRVNPVGARRGSAN